MKLPLPSFLAGKIANYLQILQIKVLLLKFYLYLRQQNRYNYDTGNKNQELSLI